MKMLCRFPAGLLTALWWVICCLQGLSRETVISHLRNRHLASAVCQIVGMYSASIPALRDLTERDVSHALFAAAQALSFVQECHTRLFLKSGAADVTRSDIPSKVCPANPCLFNSHPAIVALSVWHLHRIAKLRHTGTRNADSGTHLSCRAGRTVHVDAM